MKWFRESIIKDYSQKSMFCKENLKEKKKKGPVTMPKDF
jgi:hypothetical protein